jgi:hypothetical protein
MRVSRIRIIISILGGWFEVYVGIEHGCGLMPFCFFFWGVYSASRQRLLKAAKSDVNFSCYPEGVSVLHNVLD